MASAIAVKRAEQTRLRRLAVVRAHDQRAGSAGLLRRRRPAPWCARCRSCRPRRLPARPWSLDASITAKQLVLLGIARGGDSPVVPLITRPSQPCQPGWTAQRRAPAASRAPSSGERGHHCDQQAAEGAGRQDSHGPHASRRPLTKAGIAPPTGHARKCARRHAVRGYGRGGVGQRSATRTATLSPRWKSCPDVRPIARRSQCPVAV